MTKKHLYPTAFWVWSGWDFLKWITGMSILIAVLWVIWCHNVKKDPLMIFNKEIRCLIRYP